MVRPIGTNGNRAHDSAHVLAWLRKLDRAEPFVLSGVGYDFVEGAFVAPVRDPVALAHNVYAFCPDFWNQGLGLFNDGPPEEGIARYFTSARDFFLWRD